MEEYPFLNFQTCTHQGLLFYHFLPCWITCTLSNLSLYQLLLLVVITSYYFFALFQVVRQLPQEKQGFILEKTCIYWPLVFKGFWSCLVTAQISCLQFPVRRYYANVMSNRNTVYRSFPHQLVCTSFAPLSARLCHCSIPHLVIFCPFWGKVLAFVGIKDLSVMNF